jgi:hypothetical protein
MLLMATGWCGSAAAEPYLAAREGLKCMACHVNPTGGGMRTAFGNIYAQNQLAVERIDTANYGQWLDSASNLLTLGGDLRSAATYTSVPHEGATSAFATEEMRLYVAANVIPDRLLVYADERIAPGAAYNREAYARLGFRGGRYYLKAGQMYLPYGLRLQDDSAFVRQVPGINYSTPDNGVEFGYEGDSSTTQLAITNGSAGGPESDPGKQYSLRSEYVRHAWRVGSSVNANDSSAGQRRMGNVFGGLRTGTVTWLAEADYVVDDGFATGRRRLWASLLEANWLVRQGHNLKLTGEHFDPDLQLRHDEQNRYSLSWEYTPFQFLQVRSGLRIYDGIPQNDLQNRRAAFVELHGFF